MQHIQFESKLLDHALFYAEQGWPVFPCKLDKSPMISSGFKSASTCEKQIREWWSRWPDASIGFALPEDIVVIDVDIDHANGKFGDISLKKLIEEIGPPPTTTLVSRTGGGGLHYFFKTNLPLRCKNRLFPGIDLKTKGGYVILPPSMHPSGERYKWEVPNEN